jgi:hypothetical protein
VDDRNAVLIIEREVGANDQTDRVQKGTVRPVGIPWFWLDPAWLWQDPLPDRLTRLPGILAAVED